MKSMLSTFRSFPPLRGNVPPESGISPGRILDAASNRNGKKNDRSREIG